MNFEMVLAEKSSRSVVLNLLGGLLVVFIFVFGYPWQDDLPDLADRNVMPMPQVTTINQMRNFAFSSNQACF